jgi:hypothetical protein
MRFLVIPVGRLVDNIKIGLREKRLWEYKMDLSG